MPPTNYVYNFKEISMRSKGKCQYLEASYKKNKEYCIINILYDQITIFS